VVEPVLVSVGLGALGNIIADGVTAGSGAARARLRRDPERRLLSDAAASAILKAFSVARRPNVPATTEWVEAVAAQWTSAFTPAVIAQLVTTVSAPSAGSRQQFEDLVRTALMTSGCDLPTLDRTVSVEEFTHALPKCFWAELNHRAHEGTELRDLVNLLIIQRADHRAADTEPSSPSEYRQDLSAYLQHVIAEAREGLHSFVGRDLDLSLDQRVRVRAMSRLSDTTPDDREQRVGRAYQVPTESVGDVTVGAGSERPWEEIRDSSHQIVVLSDPGLGKSRLIRRETIRLASEALDALDEGRTPIIPVPVRADRLVRTSLESLDLVAMRSVAEFGWLAERSLTRFAEQVAAGDAFLLIDGLDEIPDDNARQAVRAALATWSNQSRDRRWIVTSRIAGYAGSLTSTAVEVELQTFTPSQVEAYVRAWDLAGATERRLLTALQDPAVAGMARIPLLLTMLCSLASDTRVGEELPRTRKSLYERMLLWFLNRPHRGGRPSTHNPEMMLTVLAGVAFDFANRAGGWVDLMRSDDLVRTILEQPEFPNLHVPADDLVEKLSIDYGLLVMEGDSSHGRTARYLFVHRTFAEFLACRHLATLDEQRRWAVVEHHLWFDPEWTQVLSMLGGMLETGQAQQLVTQLLRVHDDAYLQAWLAALRVLSEVRSLDAPMGSVDEQHLRVKLAWALGHPDLSWSVVSVLRGMPVQAPVVVQALLTLTESEEPGTRAAAIRSLANVERPDPTHHLLSCLQDSDENVAAEAASALTGRASPWVINALVSGIFTGRTRVAGACVDALAGLPESQRLQAIAPYLEADKPGPVRIAAYDVLKGMGAMAVPLILTGLEDDDPDVFVAAANAVGTAPLNSRVEALLLQRMVAGGEEPNPDDDMIVWTGNLGRRRDRDAQAARQALRRGGCQNPIFATYYLRWDIDGNSHPYFHGSAAGPRNPTHALIDELLIRLKDPEHPAQQKVAVILHDLRPSGIDDLLVDLLGSDHKSTLLAALEVSAGRDDDGLTSRISELIKHSDDDVRVEALRIVIGLEPPDRDGILLEALHDASARVRSVAAQACAGRGDLDPSLVAALLKCTSETEDSDIVVVSAIQALQGLHYPGVREALLACLSRESHEGPKNRPKGANLGPVIFNPGPPVHVAAARALAETDSASAQAAVEAHRNPDGGYVGRDAAGALARNPEQGALELLLWMLDWRKAGAAAHNALIQRPSPQDLLTIVNRLGEAKGRTRHRLMSIAHTLAQRHYSNLSANDQAVVREKIAAAQAVPDSSKDED
jgi:HEAT repeat protein